MQPKQAEQNVPNTPHAGNKFSDEATKSRIRKHLSDINDMITEDDIRNVVTHIFAPVHSETPLPVRR